MEKFLFIAETEVNIGLVLVKLLFVLLLEIGIGWVYYKTSDTLSYSQSTLIGIMLLGAVSSMIMMIISENIFGAFALFIVFSLIRFRSVLKETRDTVFMIFSLAIGISAGLGYFMITSIGTVAVLVLIVFLHSQQITRNDRSEQLLVLVTTGKLWEAYREEVKSTIARQEVLSQKEISTQQREYMIRLTFKKDGLPTFLDTLRNAAGVSFIELTNEKGTIEY